MACIRHAAFDWRAQGRHRVLWLGVFALLWLQILRWVAGSGTNYAVLACSDFPQCQGSW